MTTKVFPNNLKFAPKTFLFFFQTNIFRKFFLDSKFNFLYANVVPDTQKLAVSLDNFFFQKSWKLYFFFMVCLCMPWSELCQSLKVWCFSYLICVKFLRQIRSLQMPWKCKTIKPLLTLRLSKPWFLYLSSVTNTAQKLREIELQKKTVFWFMGKY